MSGASVQPADPSNPYEELLDEVLLRGLSGRNAPEGLKVVSVDQIGRLLRRQRLKLNFTQAQMGKRAGVGRRFISELESGKATIHACQMLQVCAADGVSLAASIASTPETVSPPLLS